MEKTTVTLNNGMEMPLVGLGTWKSKPGEVRAAVKHALKVGYRHIDGALVYQNEAEVGEGIKDAMTEFGIKREDIFVVSKLWNSYHHPDDVEKGCRKTLDDLGLDYVDLYLIHWPIAFKGGHGLFPKNEDGTFMFDDSDPVLTWPAMEKLVEKGLVKSIGVSNFNSKQVQDVLDQCKIKPVVNQVECHPYLGQKKLHAFLKERDIFVTAYSPLGSNDSPFRKAENPKVLEDPKLLELAKKHGKTPAQVIIRWLVQRSIIVIPKSVTPSRIEENFQVYDFKLSEEDMKVVDDMDRNLRQVLPLNPDGSYRDGAHPHFPFHLEF